jgi:hypothetical protein
MFLLQDLCIHCQFRVRVVALLKPSLRLPTQYTLSFSFASDWQRTLHGGNPQRTQAGRARP